MRKESGWNEQNDVGQAALRFYSDLVDPLHVPRDELTLTFSHARSRNTRSAISGVLAVTLRTNTEHG